jgi:hypothetical protein
MPAKSTRRDVAAFARGSSEDAAAGSDFDVELAAFARDYTDFDEARAPVERFAQEQE